MARKSIFWAPVPFRDLSACDADVVILHSERAGALGGDWVLTKKLLKEFNHGMRLA
jgi:hypothetical protein